jgi:hypothetical protein
LDQQIASHNKLVEIVQNHDESIDLLSYDGADVHLLLHFPMVPEDSLLKLFCLHPFPLPLSDTHSLVPNTDNNILMHQNLNDTIPIFLILIFLDAIKLITSTFANAWAVCTKISTQLALKVYFSNSLNLSNSSAHFKSD